MEYPYQPWQNHPEGGQQPVSGAPSSPSPTSPAPPPPQQPGWQPSGQGGSGGNPYTPPGQTGTGGNPYTAPGQVEQPAQPAYPPQQPGGYPPYGGYVPPPAPPQSGWTTVPYSPPQGQPPVYRVPYRPAYIPPVEDPTKPLLRVAGFRIDREQFTRLNTLNGGTAVAVQVLLLVILALVGLVAVVDNVGYGDTLAIIVAVSLTVLSVLSFGLFMVVSRVKKQKEIRRAYACAERAGDGQSIAELYCDRVEVLTARGKSVIRYAEAQWWEYPDMLVLMGPGACRVFRAEDIAPAQLEAISRIILPRLRPNARRIRGAFYPMGAAPLPLPVFRNDDQVYTAFRVSWEELPPASATLKRIPALLSAVLPFATVVALNLSNQYEYTKSLAADIGINLLIFWVLAAMGLGIVMAVRASGRTRKIRARDAGASYAFTRDGLARNWAESTVFIPADYVSASMQADRVRLDTPYGTYTVLLEDVPDPAAMRAALGGYATARRMSGRP